MNVEVKFKYSFLILVLCGLFLILSEGAKAEDKPDYGNYPEDVKQYFHYMFNENQNKYAFREDYPGGFQVWQMDTRPVLHKLVGLDKIAEQIGDFKPTVQFEEAENLGDHTRQQGWIETEPHVRIKFWLLKPKTDGTFPLAIFPHGHDKRGYDTSVGFYHEEAHRKKIITQDRDVAVQAVKRGFLAIAPATRGLADDGIPDPKKRHGDRPCRAQLMHCLLAGRTPIGERVWDMQRIIDWATTLPDVDTSNILMMGNSGGGVVTIYTAACDERITVAVPSCSFTSYYSPNGYIYHCDCNMVPGILEIGEIGNVAGLIAPRYLLAVNGIKDGLHRPSDTERAAKSTKDIFTAANCRDHFDHRWGLEGHRFYKDLMWDFVMKAIGK